MVYHPDHPNRRSVYYDDTCVLCSGAATEIRKSMDVDTVGASQSLPPSVSKEELMREMYAMDESGALHKGIDAVIIILRWHPWGKYIAPMLALPGIKQIGAGAYRIIAANRYRWFGKR